MHTYKVGEAVEVMDYHHNLSENWMPSMIVEKGDLRSRREPGDHLIPVHVRGRDHPQLYHPSRVRRPPVVYTIIGNELRMEA